MIRTVALWAALIVQAASAKPATATIQGVVTAADTGSPLAGAHVSIYSKPSPDDKSIVRITTRNGDGHEPAEAGSLAITDGSGRFEFKNLEADSYTFSAERNGYQDRGLDSDYTPVREGQTVQDVVIRMTPTAAVTGKVSGHIRDTSGRPVPLVQVKLIRRKYDSRGNPSFEEDLTAQTNDLGEYRMYGVEPGRYYVVCDWDIRNWNGNSNAVRSNYPLSIFPGVVDFGKASMIEVRPAAENAGIDFQINRTALYRIRGHIIDSRTGQPPAQATVHVSGLSLTGIRSTGMAYNPADGSIASADLPPGIYVLEADTTVNDDEAADAVVTLGNSDVNDLLLTLAPHSFGPPVSGRISVEGELPKGATLESMGTGIELIPSGELDSYLYENSGFNTSMKPDGTFTLLGVPSGEFRVGVTRPPSGFYVREARLDGADVLSHVQVFSHATSLELVLAQGGQVDGVVRSESLQPAPHMQVVLVPAERNRNELFIGTTTDARGRFSFRGVAPGNYKVFSGEQFEDNAYFDPEVLKAFEALALPVQVKGSSTSSIEIRIIPGRSAP